MARNSFKIEGMKELERSIKRLGDVPQKAVTPAARKGANIWRNAAKALAPVDQGNLKKGIVLKGEKATKKGKKVYQVTFDKNKNDIFVKTSKSGKRSYYPASQEYGYFTQNGGYIPGFHFMKKAAEENKEAAEQKIVSELTKNIDKEWNKKNGS